MANGRLDPGPGDFSQDKAAKATIYCVKHTDVALYILFLFHGGGDMESMKENSRLVYDFEILRSTPPHQMRAKFRAIRLYGNTTFLCWMNHGSQHSLFP